MIPFFPDELRRRRRVGGEETILENRGGISSEHLEDRALDYVGFLIIYSVTSRESFDRVEKTYREMLDVRDGEPFQAVIVGNMSDLEDERQVSSDGRLCPLNLYYPVDSGDVLIWSVFLEGLELADQLECKFIETSAKLRRNVDKAFDMLFRDIFQHQAVSTLFLLSPVPSRSSII